MIEEPQVYKTKAESEEISKKAFLAVFADILGEPKEPDDIISREITLYWRWMKICVTLPRQLLLFWPNVWRTGK